LRSELAIEGYYLIHTEEGDRMELICLGSSVCSPTQTGGCSGKEKVFDTNDWIESDNYLTTR